MKENFNEEKIERSVEEVKKEKTESTDKEVLFQIDSIDKSYKMGEETVQALKGVSLTVYKGDYIAIIGPSGSGKTTLMNVIGCLDSPTDGTYILEGTDISQMNDSRLAAIRNQKIGFIFQGFNLLPKLSAIENVELPLIYRGVSAKKRRKIAEEALAKVGLESRKHHKPSELSGGQQQRVAIARALAGEPPILLADEPTGALDSKTGAEILELIQELNDSGHSIILITHDMNTAARAKRVVRIHDGKISEGEVSAE